MVACWDLSERFECRRGASGYSSQHSVPPFWTVHCCNLPVQRSYLYVMPMLTGSISYRKMNASLAVEHRQVVRQLQTPVE
jgi:hypothetical protein